jgi:hypothetical protein
MIARRAIRKRGLLRELGEDLESAWADRTTSSARSRSPSVGSIPFMVSAVASFVHADGDMTAAGVANRGTFTGAVGLAVAGVTQESSVSDVAPSRDSGRPIQRISPLRPG